MPHRTRDLSAPQARLVAALARAAAEVFVVDHEGAPREVDVRDAWTQACIAHPEIADWEARPYFATVLQGAVERLRD